ncbi:30S ribosome-binding factor RbfA [Roseospirillum parvum]|uniref:Ribosome-binding factor A n=1 Tax=Roseospirillum parvum TaxID=83401 RepID=A0A1G8BZ23_9PROT|nr:30S ribosome-binding factor RbfA [Roseospirillum parvum]SDH38374.1 ribosome-binding factor A [Roseospirillum parvum]
MSRHRPARAPSNRQLKVGEELRHALAWVLERGDLADPGLAQTPVTVTEVRASPDLRQATVFVVPLGGGDATEVLAALKRARPLLRHEIARRVVLKYVPDLSFAADTSFDTAAHIDHLLHRPEVARDLDGAPLKADDEPDGA